MLGKIILAGGVVSFFAGAIGGFATDFHSPVYVLVPVGVLMLIVGTVQSLNTPDDR